MRGRDYPRRVADFEGKRQLKDMKLAMVTVLAGRTLF